MNNIKITLTLGNIMLKNSTLKSSQHSQYCCKVITQTPHISYSILPSCILQPFISKSDASTDNVSFQSPSKRLTCPPRTHRRFFKHLQSVFVSHNLAAVALSNVSQKRKAAPPKQKNAVSHINKPLPAHTSMCNRHATTQTHLERGTNTRGLALTALTSHSKEPLSAIYLLEKR